ncbi:MAG: hypothetical protein WAW10_12315 [Gallionella sp.]
MPDAYTKGKDMPIMRDIIDFFIIHDIHRRAGFARRAGRSPAYQSRVVASYCVNLSKLALMLALLACGMTGSAQAAEPVAMVTDMEGKVALVESTGKSALSILSEIRQGDKLRLENGARMDAVYLESGQKYEFNGPAVVQFGTSQPQSLGGIKPEQKGLALAKGGKNIRIKPVSVAQAAIVWRSVKPSSKIKLLGLSGTIILESRPVFRWQAVQPGLKYQFRLTDGKGNLVYEALVEGISFELPQQVHLSEANNYTWAVSAELPGGGEISNAGDFSVASSKLQMQAESLRPASTAPLSERVVFAAWLEQAGLRDEARKYWKSAAAERPDDHRLKAMAGE